MKAQTEWKPLGVFVIAVMLSACNHGSSTVAPTTTTATTTTTTTTGPTEVDLSGEVLLTGVTERSQFTATATLADGTTQDVTRAAAWQSSNPSVAIVTSGVVTTLSGGSTTLTATYQSVAGSLELAVAPVVTMIKGVVIGSNGQRGTFQVTIQGAVTSDAAPTSAVVSGTLQAQGSDAVALSGFYDSFTGVVTLSGFSGGQFALSGTIAGGALTGTYTGPDGVSGTFSGASSNAT